jgi:prepilin peptidase CpaA
MSLGVVAATAILVAGVTDDLRSRKFHNWLFLVCTGVAFAVVLVSDGIWGLPLALLGFAAGILVLLPLVLAGVIGAGDMKLMAAFGIAAGWESVFPVALFSLFWGALFGLIQVTLGGHLKTLLKNIGSIAMGRGREDVKLHKIPFTVAIAIGWLTHLVYAGVL